MLDKGFPATRTPTGLATLEAYVRVSNPLRRNECPGVGVSLRTGNTAIDIDASWLLMGRFSTEQIPVSVAAQDGSLLPDSVIKVETNSGPLHLRRARGLNERPISDCHGPF